MEPYRKVNIAIVGASRGRILIEYEKYFQAMEVVGICDTNDSILTSYSKTLFATYNYKDFLNLDNLDAVYIATPPDSHAEISAFFLKNNISVLCEVPACLNETEANLLMEAKKYSTALYMMAENYCYIPENLAIGEIIKSGKLGEIVYVSGSYIHDCKELLVENGELTWRGKWNVESQLNHYPTHSMGSICQWLDIGDLRSDTIVQMENHGSDHKALTEFFDKHFIKNKITQPDIVFTRIITKKGRLVHLRYDTKSYRPHLKNGYEIQGTEGWIQSGRYDNEEPLVYFQSSEQIQKLRDREEYKRAIKEVMMVSDDTDKRSVNFYMLRQFMDSIGTKKSPISLSDSILWSSPIWC